VAGTFGVVGAAGALVAPFAGRASDKHGPRWVVAMGIATLAGSYLLLWVEERCKIPNLLHLAGLVLGVVLLDCGAQMTQVANQTRIFGLVPSARSRLNTVYMVTYFLGGALGSALGAYGWSHWRWSGVCVAGTTQLVVALAMRTWMHVRRETPRVATARETSLA